MNYEEKYKEALEKAKTFYETKSPDCLILESIFPELAENEDERMSREITKFLVDYYNGKYERPNENTIDSWLSWLEKQGEQKPSWSEEDEYQLNTILHGLDLKRELYKKEGNKVEEERYNTQYNWLKSLKPNHWKPSEYDISLLEEIARNIRNNIRPFCSEVSSLEALTDTLKNL